MTDQFDGRIAIVILTVLYLSIFFLLRRYDNK